MSTLEWAISPEHPTESVAIETLLDEVLGPTRHRRGVYRLRVPGGHTRSLSFAAYADRYLIASIRFWPVAKIRGACLLGPLAVRSTYQDAGIGGALV